MAQVSFTHTRSGEEETFLCRETGVAYQLRANSDLGYYEVFNSGVFETYDTDRDRAVRMIEQLARIDFICAQAACGAYAS